jgi:hypothetical protein
MTKPAVQFGYVLDNRRQPQPFKVHLMRAWERLMPMQQLRQLEEAEYDLDLGQLAAKYPFKTDDSND